MKTLWIVVVRKKRTKTWELADLSKYRNEDQAIEEAQEYAKEERENEFGVASILYDSIRIVKT